MPGQNHKDGCDGSDFEYSGEGYNRVRVCVCGAEDHDPDSRALAGLYKLCKEIVDEEDAQLETTGRLLELAQELHAGRDYTEREMEYFQLVVDILTQIRADGVPAFAVNNWLRKHES